MRPLHATAVENLDELRAVRASLRTLRAEVLHDLAWAQDVCCRVARAAAASAGEAIALRRDKGFLQQSLADREHVEAELRAALRTSEKGSGDALADAVTARRLALEANKRAADAEATAADVSARMEQLVADRTSGKEAAHREAVTSALACHVYSTNSRVTAVELSSELAATREQLVETQLELDQQRASHGARLAELQEAFQAKIRNIKRAGQTAKDDERMRDVVSLAPLEVSAAAAAKITRAETSAAAAERRAAVAEKKVAEMLDAVDAAKAMERDAIAAAAVKDRQLRVVTSEAESAQRAAAAMETRLLTAQRAAEDAQREASLAATRVPRRDCPNQEVVVAVEAMEAKMIKLSCILRDKEAEVSLLKSTVHEACRERSEAQRALLELLQREREESKEPNRLAE